MLGDRIRMQAHALDSGVFIRRMATRGSLGGLARATRRGAQAARARSGYDWVLVETVGVGQTELDVMKLADTTVVVLVPESGDAIQTMKAGLMEAADIFVVNKADRAGAPALMAELKFAAHLHYAELDLAQGHRLGDPGAVRAGPGRRRHRGAAGGDPPSPRRAGVARARSSARRAPAARAELRDAARGGAHRERRAAASRAASSAPRSTTWRPARTDVVLRRARDPGPALAPPDP